LGLEAVEFMEKDMIELRMWKCNISIVT